MSRQQLFEADTDFIKKQGNVVEIAKPSSKLHTFYTSKILICKTINLKFPAPVEVI